MESKSSTYDTWLVNPSFMYELTTDDIFVILIGKLLSLGQIALQKSICKLFSLLFPCQHIKLHINPRQKPKIQQEFGIAHVSIQNKK